MRLNRLGYLIFTLILYWYFTQLVLAESLSLMTYKGTLGFIITQIITLDLFLPFKNTYLNVLLNGYGEYIYVDQLSAWFLWLTAFLFVLVALLTWNLVYRYNLFVTLAVILQLSLVICFITPNLLIFYVFFEIIVLAMFFMIGIYGSRQRRRHAALYFFFYSLIGSFCLLYAIFHIYSWIGTVDVRVLSTVMVTRVTGIDEVVCLALSLAFIIKMPLFPLHTWLPEAHVEASTPGSVLLAGILLKLGGFGFLRFVLPIFPLVVGYVSSYVIILAMLGIIYVSLISLRQVDLKKIIAYASIVHMSYVQIGLFSGTKLGVAGAIQLMIAHGLISSGLFICVGILYDRYHTRIIHYYGGLTVFMPLFALFFGVYTFSNMSFPGTAGFVGEHLILNSSLNWSLWLAFVGILGTFLGALSSIWLFTRLFFGPVKKFIISYSDISKREWFILSLLLFWIIAFGIAPTAMLMDFDIWCGKMLF